MNSNMVRALLADARYQVLDNKVFRLLIIVVLLLIALTFVVGFREHEMVLLFGVKKITYASMFETFGVALTDEIVPQELFIEGILRVITELFAGSFGIIFCCAATAFFVPRMLQKGAADTLFSKPIGRFVLLLSRYLSGLLFVALLATVLVVGIWAGFAVSSGWSDPGILWAAVTLLYLYAIIQAFSLAIAALTRSTTAAILLTIVIFMSSGCLHAFWYDMEMRREQNVSRSASDEPEEPEDEAAAGEAEEDEEEEEDGLFLLALYWTFDAVHYTLPKTTDADVLTRQLRRAIEGSGPVFTSDDELLIVGTSPRNYELVASTQADLEGDGLLWRAVGEKESTHGEVRLQRRDQRLRVTPGGNQRPESTRFAANRLQEELEARLGPGLEVERGRSNIGQRAAVELVWEEELEGRQVLRELTLATYEEHLYLLDRRIDAGELSRDHRGWWQRRFLGQLGLGRRLYSDHKTWLTDRMTWDAEWYLSTWFSLGSSLAFAGLMLAIAWLRIRRMDF